MPVRPINFTSASQPDGVRKGGSVCPAGLSHHTEVPAVPERRVRGEAQQLAGYASCVGTSTREKRGCASSVPAHQRALGGGAQRPRLYLTLSLTERKRPAPFRAEGGKPGPEASPGGVWQAPCPGWSCRCGQPGCKVPAISTTSLYPASGLPGPLPGTHSQGTPGSHPLCQHARLVGPSSHPNSMGWMHQDHGLPGDGPAQAQASLRCPGGPASAGRVLHTLAGWTSVEAGSIAARLGQLL